MSRENLVGWILEQARRGVYREDLMAYSGATRRETAEAIRKAKVAGMYSVPDMRSPRGDTWYQAD